MSLIQSFPCLFELQVACFPDRYALSMDEKQYTYAQLNEKANQLANYLLEIKCHESSFIVLFLDKSELTIIAILAILKAGMTYVPISPEATPSIINSVLENTKAQYIITDSDKIKQLEQEKIKIIQVDKIQHELIKLSKTNLLTKPLASDFAYIIYTSGTTDNPKGVMVTHSNLLCVYNSWKEVYKLTEADIHLQMANVAFDVFVGDYLRALGSGAELVLCSKDIIVNPERLIELIINKKITCAEFIPAVLRNLMFFLKKHSHLLNNLRLLICGSDLWAMAEFREVKKILGNKTRVINSYGLTETTIDSTYFEEDNNIFGDAELVPIGKPFAHATLYVLDEQFNVLTHDIGEIYIGGLGVAFGYIYQKKLTQERFIYHPIIQERLYKTGDLGRFREDGNIELLGRNQSHVKINGNRVELLTLESILNHHPKINFCIVASKLKSNKIELGCFILTEDDSLTLEEINAYICSYLPIYYIPRNTYLINEVVLTQNGKVDRSWSAQKIKKELKYHIDITINPVEFDILTIWRKLLNIDEIGMNQNFYELGGTSLNFAEMIKEINQRFQVYLSYNLTTLTVKDLSRLILKQKSCEESI